MPFDTDIEFAQRADADDVLASFKQHFHFPQKNGRDAIYFCGNSLGLQPKNVEAAIQDELNTWKEIAIGGYFGGKNPWLFYQDYMKSSLAKIVGCGKTK
jgi:kynureninase